MKVVIYTSSAYTGGPFALMQLYLELRARKVNCEMLYYDKASIQLTNTQHSEALEVSYNDGLPHPLADINGLDQTPVYASRILPEDVLILPEVLIPMLLSLHQAGFKRTVLWWLSWDNAKTSNMNHLSTLNALHTSVHIFQSHYARDQARKFGLDGLLVSDYTLSFENSTRDKLSEHKSIDLCYFEKKALGAQELIETLKSEFNVVSINNLKQEQVKDLMRSTKVFLDLGNHPGKDRMPREAALCECIPVVRRVGAADYYSDVPLPEDLKLTVQVLRSTTLLVQILRALLNNWESYNNKLNSYRWYILSEREMFSREVESFILFVLKDRFGYK
jgi:hypothetical protein